MTTAQLDHLRAIIAHLDRLLDIAAKRTPGEWDVENISPARHDVVKKSGGKITSIFRAHDGCHEYREAALPDAAYIASCSNSADAGWRSTKAAIDSLLRYIERSQSIGDHCGIECANGVIESILAEWPLETLQTK